MLRRCFRWRCKPPQPAREAAAAAAAEGKAATSEAAAAAASASGDAAGASAAQTQAPPKERRRFSAHGSFDSQAAGRNEAKKFFSGFLTVSTISLGLSFVAVPLFRLYCSPQGRGADAKFIVNRVKENDDNPHKHRRRLLNVTCLCDVGNTMPIKFVPLQKKMQILVGEPALAFYSAYNKTNRTLLGVSTYSIAPAEATPYLSKIQCFCFEEQRFKPHELVEMPVFFFMDKDFLNDPVVNWLDDIILHYTFFNLDSAREYVKKN